MTRVTVLLLFLAAHSAADDLIPDDLDTVTVGVAGIPLSEATETLEKNGLDKPRTRSGFWVTYVGEGTGAAIKGLRPMDVISRIDTTSINSKVDIQSAITGKKSGDNIRVTAFRARKVGSKLQWSRATNEIPLRTIKEASLSVLTGKADDFKDVTFVRHIKSAKSFSERDDVYLYFARDAETGKPAQLRLVFQYVAKDWLFINQIETKSGEKTMLLDTRLKMKRDNGRGKIWEWHDIAVEKEHLDFLMAALAEASVTVRYSGDTAYSDAELTLEQRQRMHSVLIGFVALGGELPK